MKNKIESIIYEEYRVGKMLGSGATGEVYEVVCKKNNQKFAMKVSEKKHILRCEAENMKHITDRIFPQFIDYKEADCGYLIMECVEGRNLQNLLDAGMVFELSEAVWIVTTVLDGLCFLHKQMPSMVYSDLKPANIVIEEAGGIRLIDLGSVTYSQKQDENGQVRAGTYGYAAPEQFWPDMIPHPAWDIYAAGKLLGYLLTGHNPALPPYEVEEYYQKDRRVPDVMKIILNRSLSKQAQARYTDAEEMKRYLQEAYGESKKKKWHILHKKQEFEYKKCIWLSEYRRIF